MDQVQQWNESAADEETRSAVKETQASIQENRVTMAETGGQEKRAERNESSSGDSEGGAGRVILALTVDNLFLQQRHILTADTTIGGVNGLSLSIAGNVVSQILLDVAQQRMEPTTARRDSEGRCFEAESIGRVVEEPQRRPDDNDGTKAHEDEQTQLSEDPDESGRRRMNDPQDTRAPAGCGKQIVEVSSIGHMGLYRNSSNDCFSSRCRVNKGGKADSLDTVTAYGITSHRTASSAWKTLTRTSGKTADESHLLFDETVLWIPRQSHRVQRTGQRRRISQMKHVPQAERVYLQRSKWIKRRVSRRFGWHIRPQANGRQWSQTEDRDDDHRFRSKDTRLLEAVGGAILTILQRTGVEGGRFLRQRGVWI